ncbi:helix-turn-helix domain-containing protein [Alicyclobacillus macrosporangiidus]|uniref:helix-turn-helix domain-containing protein n=1 Tax=Alicyclobacillus macrosporangiidus TaxID=392015 RepID=UPI000A462A96|nr:helix-turn-helix transcriptional regulator [Alicyclobacillus macrosporangiidus]
MKQLREIRHLKESDVAHFLGISEQLYRKLESSEFDIPATALMELAVFYGVTTDFLVGLSDDLAAAGRIQKPEAVEFLRIMLEARSTNRGVYEKFCAIVHEVASNPEADVFAIAARHFPQHAEELKSLRRKDSP